MQKVSEKIAREDFERWFESKRLGSSFRSGSYEVIEKQMIDAICDGSIIINEDNTITLKLSWPLTQPNQIDELIFVHRMQTGAIQARTKIAKTQEEKLLYTIAALTNNEGGIIRALDPSDFSNAGCVASYFF